MDSSAQPPPPLMRARTESISQKSDNSQTAAEASSTARTCSVQCHGEHTLVEIFTKRDFTCDCGTTRFPESSPCSLRINPATNTKGGVHSEEPSANNKYNQNFRNRFCGCECDYDPFQQKGTMFQCLGLGTHEIGGCGEDWWHPGCVVGLGPDWFENMKTEKIKVEAKDDTNGALPIISEDTETANGVAHAEEAEEEDNDPPPPPGFPAEDDFEAFLCYKCVDAHPWIKRYAGTPGFLPPVYLKREDATQESTPAAAPVTSNGESNSESKKRKAEDDETDSQTSKRPKNDDTESTTTPAEPTNTTTTTTTTTTCKLFTLPHPHRTIFPLPHPHLPHLPLPLPLLLPAPHAPPQLLEEEETYEPPLSTSGGSEHNGSTNSGGSLYDRGESALRNNVDRVRAIEGIMAYEHLKDKLTPFFRQFAESGEVISAEDVKEYFAKLRGMSRGSGRRGGGEEWEGGEEGGGG
ncbi:hypothetical protein N0V88_002515 [Collariella sp. IMI 366227]|nr:hypothetical protein N0V88_002515 [Collariella sp. IMI 366227]